MLINLSDPPIDSIKWPPVGDVIYQQDPLSPAGIRAKDGAEPPLSWGVPKLQLHSPPIQKNGGGFIVNTAAVSVWGLSRAILQAVQDLSFAHIAVSNQEELEQVVVAFHGAALAAHGVSHLNPGAMKAEDGNWKPTNPLVCFAFHLDQNKGNVCYALN